MPIRAFCFRPAGYGKFNIVLVLAAGFAFAGMGMENVNVSIIIPYAKLDMDISVAEQGLLNSAGFIGLVATSHLWGFLADTWGRKKVMQTSLFGGFMFAFTSAFCTSVLWLTIFRTIVGAL